MLELLDAYDIDLNGKEVCVLGRGITIGRTIGLMLTRNAVNATVTLCHTGTRDVADHMRRADVIVAAMGSAGFVTPDKIKDGAVLVDVGVSRVYDEEAGRYRIKATWTRLLRQGLRLHPQPRRRGPHDPSHAPSQRRGNGRTTRLEFPRKFGQSCLYCEYLYACRVCVITEYREIIHPLLETIYLHGREQH